MSMNTEPRRIIKSWTSELTWPTPPGCQGVVPDSFLYLAAAETVRSGTCLTGANLALNIDEPDRRTQAPGTH